MRFKNSFRLFSASTKTILRDLLFRGVTFIVFATVAYFFITPFIGNIFAQTETEALFEALKKVVGAFFTGAGEFKSASEELFPIWDGFVAMLSGKLGEIYSVSAVTGILIILASMFFGLAEYASGKSVYTYSTSLKSDGYLKSILENFGKAFLYQLVYSVVSFVWNAFVFALTFFFFKYTVAYLTIFSLTFSIIIVALGISVKKALFSDFLPAVCSGEKVFKAFADCFAFKGKKKDFGMVYGLYLFTNGVIFFVNVSVAIFTFGAGLFFTVPASFVFISCENQVVYFSRTKRKYFIDYNTVVNPSELGLEEEKLLKGIDM
ncbi:MAG: hypothetical protein PUJ49_07170 [bacterium]|nr:hypothetical protein [bacterium]